MNYRSAIFLTCIAACLAIETGWADQASTARPNILIILTDDQGYGDLGCYGATAFKTPRLDQLAREGTRFTSGYAQPVCGPARSALLTGRYPNRSQGWSMPADEVTFAELMRKSGYQTACIGKWDVSNRKAIVERMPNAQGFDYYFGPLGANDKGIVHFHENNAPAGKERNMASLSKLYTDKSIAHLRKMRKLEKPFLLYLSHTMVHMNIDASSRFKGKSNGSLYGDAIEELDYETGRLLDELESLDLARDTIVIFSSDNGPWNQGTYRDRKLKSDSGKGFEGTTFWGSSGPLRGGKGSTYEGGSRVPFLVRWPGRVPAGRVSDAVISHLDLLPTFSTWCGYRIPEDRVIDGIDQRALLLGQQDQGRKELFFMYKESVHGVRMGNWKYLRKERKGLPTYVEERGTGMEELYDLGNDVSEAKNLSSNHPERVRRMNAAVEAFIASSNKESK